MAVFDPQARLGVQGDLLCLEVQEPWAVALVEGAKTIETRRYSLPAWARNVDVAILQSSLGAAGVSSLGESPEAGAGSLVGVVVFGDSVRYDSEAHWRSDEPFHRIAQGDAYDWDGTERHGWVIASARTAAPPVPSPPLARRFRSFYGPAPAATAASEGGVAVVAGALEAVIPMAALTGKSPVPVPSGKHREKHAVSVSAVLAMLPDTFFKATLDFKAGIFTAADRVQTKPIPKEEFLQGFLCFAEPNGKPLAAGGPLRLAYPDGVAVQCGPCGSKAPADLKNVVRLELLRDI